MSISHTLLGLLEAGPRHGYDLKRTYDERFGQDRPLHYGQVYSTLSRLLKNSLVEVTGVESGDGPDRKRYTITDAGITDVETWLRTPEKPETYLQNTLYTKVVLALLSGRSAVDVLDIQRAEHLATMRVLTKRKSSGDLADALICDHALFHLEADLRWLELTTARLDQLAGQMAGKTPPWRPEATGASETPPWRLAATGGSEPASDPLTSRDGAPAVPETQGGHQ